MRNAERTLARLDLNLLVTLDALLAERHVTRAARRLGLSQPAVSVQLGKLRRTLQDPLLVPGPRGMAPTSLACGLEGPLRAALQQLVQVIAPARAFDPAQAALTWRVAASDYSARAIVQPLVPRLRRDAPGARLAVLQAEPLRMGRQAENADIDLAFVTLDAAPDGLLGDRCSWSATCSPDARVIRRCAGVRRCRSSVGSSSPSFRPTVAASGAPPTPSSSRWA